MLDLRAPVEFARGAFPRAHNLPLMTDAERAQVGTCYKAEGQQAAIELGHRLVGGATRQQRLSQWVDFARQNPEGYLYCFRGGLRSQTVQQWLAEAGVTYRRIAGGYKAMRQFLLEQLDRAATELDIVLIAGRTGSGKTRLLPRLSRAIDLEGLAAHRGSAFGALLAPQPTQIDFENALAVEVLHALQRPGTVFLEDESRLIGRRSVPLALHERMQAAHFLELDIPFAQRIDGVLADYVIDLRARYQRAAGEDGARLHQERLLEDLSKLRRRLGGARYEHLQGLMQEAFVAQHATGDVQGHREWIGILLRDYYDPMYDYQMAQRADKRILRGDADTLCAWVQQRELLS